MKNLMIGWGTAFVCVLVLCSTGCATIFNQNAHASVSIESSQSETRVCVYNRDRLVAIYTTPVFLNLEASDGFFKGSSYRFEFSKPGYLPYTDYRVSNVSGWYWLNFVLGGIIGLVIVDPISGKMYKIDGASIYADLTPIVEADVKTEPARPQPVNQGQSSDSNLYQSHQPW